ncbi:MAG: MoaD/ThiS family protein [Leucobacter sp.]
MAQITVRYFAAAAEAAGVDEERLDFGGVPTLKELRRGLSERHGGAMDRVMATGSFLVDGTVRRDDGELRGDTVDVLPPFAGG